MKKNVLKFMIFVSFAFIAFFCNAMSTNANTCNGYMYADQTCWLGLGYICEDKVLSGQDIGTYATITNKSEGCYIKAIYNEKVIQYKGKEYTIDFKVKNGQGNEETYKVRVFTPKKSLEEMDSSFEYGSVSTDNCSKFLSRAVKVEFDGLTACGITDTDIDYYSVTEDGNVVFDQEKESFKGGCDGSTFDDRKDFAFRAKGSSGEENRTNR